MKAHTHTHTHTHAKYCGLVGVDFKCGVQSKTKHESHDSCVCIVGFSACGCQKKSVVSEAEFRHIAVQKGKQDQNHSYH